MLLRVVFIIFFCIPCYKKLTCDHQGTKDVADHCGKESHKNCVEESNKQGNLNSFLNPSDSAIQLDQQVINAEVMMTNFLVQHNLPLATSDHLGSLFKQVFSDSKIARNQVVPKQGLSSVNHLHHIAV